MDVFVDGMRLDWYSTHLSGDHTPHVGHGAVGHEPATKTFHKAVGKYLLGLMITTCNDWDMVPSAVALAIHWGMSNFKSPRVTGPSKGR